MQTAQCRRCSTSSPPGRNVYRYLRPTPLYRYAGLSALIGAQLWVKHENHLPVGAFKVRGGLNLVAQLSAKERASGLFTASTGNHGQSIAFAARAHGVRATIAVPEGANPGKVAAMRGLGAEVVFHGPDFDSCARVGGGHGCGTGRTLRRPHRSAADSWRRDLRARNRRGPARGRHDHRSGRRGQRRLRHRHRRQEHRPADTGDRRAVGASAGESR